MTFIQFLAVATLATFSSLSSARDLDEPQVCFSNPRPVWDVNKSYNISTIFQKGICQITVTFSDDRFPAIYFTTTAAERSCDNGEINQIRLPQAVPNGEAKIQQTCPVSRQALCVGITIQNGRADPYAFNQTDNLTVERVCSTNTAFEPFQPTSISTIESNQFASSSLNPSSTRLPSISLPNTAQGSSTPTQNSASTVNGVNTRVIHTVYLDYSQNVFNPRNITGKVGDNVEFVFEVPNHNIVETSLQEPCVPLGGFESGLETMPGGDFNNSVSFTITKQTPRYFSCGKPGHCQNGMVFAVNASPERFAKFLSNARASKTSVVRNNIAINTSSSAIPTICSVCPTTLIPSTTPSSN